MCVLVVKNWVTTGGADDVFQGLSHGKILASDSFVFGAECAVVCSFVLSLQIQY